MRIAPGTRVLSHAPSSLAVAPNVALACADDELLLRTVAHLRHLGTSPAAHSNLSELPATAERCDVVVIFADGFGSQPLLTCLDALEQRRAGPRLIVVTDRVPWLWTPKIARDERATIVTQSVWEANGPAMVKECRRTTARDDSGPELPFTD